MVKNLNFKKSFIPCLLILRYVLGGTECSEAIPSHCWDNSVNHYPDGYEATSWTNLDVTGPTDSTVVGEISNILDNDIFSAFEMPDTVD